MKTGILAAALIAALCLARAVFADLGGEPAPHRTYWSSGGPRSSISMVDGVREGPAASWYADGTKQSEGAYVDGLREGAWRYWLEDGTPDRERSGSYRGGKRVEP